MKNLSFKEWLIEQEIANPLLNAEIEKAIITAKAKGGNSTTAMPPKALANIITPDLLRNPQVQKAIKDKLNTDTTIQIDKKNKEAQQAAKTAKPPANPATKTF